MTLIHAIILAIVQGLTEFLPVSSSGHLVLTQALLGLTGEHLLFDTVVHLGTLLAVLVFFARDLWALARGAVGELGRREYGRHLRFAVLVAWANLPIIVVGLLAKDWLKATFEAPRIAAGLLLVTGVLLLLTRRPRPATTTSMLELSFKWALIIGLVQCAALLPGISRSGVTICTALFLGVEHEAAGRFSFVMSIPAVTGAFVLNAFEQESLSAVLTAPNLVGFGVSFAVEIGRAHV